MSQLTVQSGLLYIATNVNALYTDWEVGLFISNYTPTATDTLATYAAIEATFPGYIRASIPMPGTPSIDMSGNATALFPPLTFTASAAPGSPQTIYGSFLVDATGSALLNAVVFATPVVITNSGDQCVVTYTDTCAPG